MYRNLLAFLSQGRLDMVHLRWICFLEGWCENGLSPGDKRGHAKCIKGTLEIREVDGELTDWKTTSERFVSLSTENNTQ